MKIQRRTARPSTLAERSISDDGNGNGIANANGAENGAHLHTVTDEVNDSNGADYANGADAPEAVEAHAELDGSNGVAIEDVASSANGSNGSNVANGSNGSHTTYTATPTLPKRRRRITSTPTEVVARPASARAEVAAAPIAAIAPAPKPPAAPWRLYITYQNIFWVAIFALTIVTRFWDLGSRGIHHDESLHANFSNVLYTGNGYVHDPMMHGPLQFHFISFMYWLFGATDATSRFASVFSGIFVVMSPFFLRKQMGRVPAMVAAFLLFISPSILYFSRMAREDAIFSGMEMIMLVGLWRFISQRKPSDFIIFCAGLSLMFTIKETSFLTLAILGIFFLALFAYQAGYAILAALGGYIVAAGGLFMYINSGMKAGSIVGLPSIANPGPDTNIIMTFAMKFITHPIFYGEVLLFILFIAGVTFLLNTQRRTLSASPVLPQRVRFRPAMAGAGAGAGNGGGGGIPRRTVRPSSTISGAVPANGHDAPEVRERVTPVAVAESETVADDTDYTTLSDPQEAQEVWDPKSMNPAPGSVFARYQPGSIPHLIGAIFSRPKILLIGVLIATLIFFTFYTVFFTDIPHGIVSGIFASLGYWMGQHDVMRGGQPWFYYFLLIPIYEPIAVFFSLAGATFFGWRGVRWLFRRRRGEDGDESENVRPLGMFNTDRAVPFASFKSFLPLFLVVWLVGTLGIYSWAGEKMPWLMMHMVRPAIFLASLFVGALLVSLMRRRRERLEAAGEYEFETTSANAPTLTNANGSNGVPARRRTGAAGVRIPQPVVARVQDPPWVTWSKPGSYFPITAFLSTFVILVIAWGLLMNGLTSKAKFDPKIYDAFAGWQWPWIVPLLTLALVVGYGVWLSPGWSLRYLGLGIFTLGLMYQVGLAIFGKSEDEFWMWAYPRCVLVLVAYYAWRVGGWRSAVYSQFFLYLGSIILGGIYLLGSAFYGGSGGWNWTWVYPLLILAMVMGYAVWLGPGRSLRYLALGILTVGLMYQFRSGVNLAYNQPDVSTELASYVQTSPDVTRAMKEVETYANYSTAGKDLKGGNDLKIMYDSFTSWPMEWYLRDYNKIFLGGGDPQPSADVPILLLEYNKHKDKPNFLPNYVGQRYAMRWWFPQEWYMDEFLPNQYVKDANGARVTDPETGKVKMAGPLSQVGDALNTVRVTITEPKFEATLWKYLIFRDPPKPLGSEDMVLYVRRDIAQLYHRLQYNAPPSTDVP